MNFEYDYIQGYLPTKRMRKTRYAKRKESYTFNLPEVNNQTFPVAFIVKEPVSYQEDMKSYEDYNSDKAECVMFAEKIRTYKGKLYKPVRVTHGTAISSVIKNANYLYDVLKNINYKDRWYEDFDETNQDAILLEDNKKDIVKELKKEIKRYVLFNGELWKICGEPYYTFNTFGLGGNHGGTGFFIGYAYSHKPSIWYFNSLYRQEAIDYVKDIALGRGDTDSVDSIGEYENIEVLMPELVKLPATNVKGNPLHINENVKIKVVLKTNEEILATPEFTQAEVGCTLEKIIKNYFAGITTKTQFILNNHRLMLKIYLKKHGSTEGFNDVSNDINIKAFDKNKFDGKVVLIDIPKLKMEYNKYLAKKEEALTTNVDVKYLKWEQWCKKQLKEQAHIELYKATVHEVFNDFSTNYQDTLYKTHKLSSYNLEALFLQIWSFERSSRYDNSRHYKIVEKSIDEGYKEWKQHMTIDVYYGGGIVD